MEKSSPTKIPSLSTSKSATTLWTSRLIATLWKLAIKRARKLRRQSQGDADESNVMYGSVASAEVYLEETLIMREAARSVIASGVVSLADLEAVTGFRLSKIEMPQAKDDDESSEAATDTSDLCSISGSDFEGIDEEFVVVNPVKRSARDPVARRLSTTSRKPAREYSEWYAYFDDAGTNGVERVEINMTRTDVDSGLVFLLDVFLSKPTSRLPVSKSNSNEERVAEACPTFKVERRFSDFEELRKNVSSCVSMERQCSCQYCLKYVEYIRFSSTQPRGLMKRFGSEEKQKKMLQTFMNDFVRMGQRRVQKTGKRKCQAQELVPNVLSEFLLQNGKFK
eukprot:jgi/Phyca11/532926/estExt2_fgenesh1_pg.C_PHYCAscaffold_90092